MSQPRRIVPGMTVLVSRRTVRRTHLLSPDPPMIELFLYCLAVIAARHGVLVHAAVLMSTHEHLVVTDTEGRLPLFLAEFHRLVALGVKVLRKWDGEVWDGAQCSVVELCTPQAVIEKLAYVAANPVMAGLVTRVADWPGSVIAPHDLGGGSREVRRPQVYLDPRNPRWPSATTLTFAMPQGLGMSASALRSAVSKEVQRLERRTVDDRPSGQPLPNRPVRLSPYGRARTWEPLRSRNPAFAVGRGQTKAFHAAVDTLRAFRAAYRIALERWRQGFRDVLFPKATWLMQRMHGAAVA